MKLSDQGNSLKDFKSNTLNPNGGWGKKNKSSKKPSKKKSSNETLRKLGF